MRIYQVGGAVRDKILGIPVNDRDYVVVGALEADLLRQGYKRVGKNFPVFLHPETGDEYAMARREIKTGSRHTDFKFVFTPDITLEEDSIRRDFTCNALYYDPETGEIIDYHHGIEDIKSHTLRHISPHFAEDPLRVLRLCRFVAQLDFGVAPETMALCRQMVAGGALKHLTPQRVWQEFQKALQTPLFYKFVLTARSCGALAELLPEVEALWQVPERLDYHPEGNAGEHVMLALKAASSSDSYLNLAVLLHDIGKIKTDRAKWPSHYGHAALGGEIIKEIARRLCFPEGYKKFSVLAAENHMVSHQPLAEEETQLQLASLAAGFADKGQKNGMERFIAVMKADICGRGRSQEEINTENFTAVAAALRQLYDVSKKVKLSALPEFPRLLSRLNKGEATPAELRKIRLKAMLAAANLSV